MPAQVAFPGLLASLSRYGLAESQATAFAAAESRIRDANIAEEAANLTRLNILNQAGIASLAQANQST